MTLTYIVCTVPIYITFLSFAHVRRLPQYAVGIVVGAAVGAPVVGPVVGATLGRMSGVANHDHFGMNVGPKVE